MRKILIVGAGQSGLQLALALQTHEYEVTLMAHRTSDEVRSGRVMSAQVMFHTALQHERDLKLNFWESQAPAIDRLAVSVAAPPPGSGTATDWSAPLDGFAQSVDQRVKMAGWMDTFAQRGGQLVLHGAAVSDLDYFSRTYDLVLVAAGKGELVSMFDRDAARSPYRRPQRALAVAYVHGLDQGPSSAGAEPVRYRLVPGVGELIVTPALTTSGRADILFWEGVPGGPVDAFKGLTDPAEHLTLTLALLKRFAPDEYARAAGAELTDAGATLTGRYTPVVRRPVGRLPSGGLALGVGDVVVTNDPITLQGSNSAAKCAASYLASILEHGDKPFDEAWMESAFARHWATARPVTRWTNAMLAPLPEHVLDLIDTAADRPELAHRIARGFDDPAALVDLFDGHRDRAEASLTNGTSVTP